ncbi:Vacuolar protein sorting-associated protein 20 [Ascosphaera pollenicola]|nr:Vacuolar protein sorting-associated protein 20 [Ascosphaera pollenicola]
MPSSQKISSQDKAILDLKNQRDKLHQYQKRITKLTDRETEIAKQCLANNNKSHALLALRRKKYQQSLLDQTDAQLEQLEKLVRNVEFSLVQQSVLHGLKQGNEVLRAIHAEMGGLEGVEKLMGETEDARAYQEEVTRMLAGQISSHDEEEVEEELEAMENEISGKNKVKDPLHHHLPAAPRTEPSKATEDEERSQREEFDRTETAAEPEAIPL